MGLLIMRYRIRKCVKCYRYTLKERCPVCGSETIFPHPARFSPEDRYVEYRVRALYRVDREGEVRGEGGSGADRS